MIISKKTSSVEIMYQTHGIPHDCELLQHLVSSVRNNNHAQN